MAKKQPWERLDREPESAYQVFLAYRDLGPGRTLERVNQECTDHAPGSVSQVKRWSSKHHWMKRVAAWDAWLQKERDRIARSDAAKWERRRLRSLESVYEDAQVLRDRVRKMLAFPLSRQRVEDQDGKRVTIVEPVRWGMRDAVAALKVIAEIEAMVLGAVSKDAGLMTDAELAGVLDATSPSGAESAGGGGV